MLLNTNTTKSFHLSKSSSKSSANGNSGGLIASALSYYLNGTSSGGGGGGGGGGGNGSGEDLPYIQQKELKKTDVLNNLTNKNQSNFSNKAITSNSFTNGFRENTSSNKATKSVSATAVTTSGGGNDANCNLPSFSISSLAYDPSIDLNVSNPAGNLLVLSSGNGLHHHQRSASSSNSTSNPKFITSASTNHTNININMTISATAIASATATATANGGQTNGGGGHSGNELMLTDDGGSSANTNTNTSNLNENNCANSLSNVSLSQPAAGSKKKQNKENRRESTSSTSLGNQKSVSKFNGNGATTPAIALINEPVVVSSVAGSETCLIKKLEEDLKRLCIELDQQKTIEQYLRNQITYMTKCDQAEKSKLEKLESENESLQTRLKKVSQQKQKEKEDLTAMERKLAEEKKLKASLEKQLAEEKKSREFQERQIKSSLAAQQQLNSKTGPSFEHSKLNMTGSSNGTSRRLSEIEAENRRLDEECGRRQEKIMLLEAELKSLAKYREAETTKADSHLIMKLNLMQDKNASLQESLSAETRFKLDLFSALGEARRQLEFANCKTIFFFFFNFS